MIEYISNSEDNGRLVVSGNVADIATDLLYAVNLIYSLLTKDSTETADRFLTFMRIGVFNDELMKHKASCDAVVIRRDDNVSTN